MTTVVAEAGFRPAVTYATMPLWSNRRSKYALRVERRDRGYLAYFPALPGCYSLGFTYAKAPGSVRELLTVYLESLNRLNEPLTADVPNGNLTAVVLPPKRRRLRHFAHFGSNADRVQQPCNWRSPKRRCKRIRAYGPEVAEAAEERFRHDTGHVRQEPAGAPRVDGRPGMHVIALVRYLYRVLYRVTDDAAYIAYSP